MIKIQVILGSTRQNRFSEKPGSWILEKLKTTAGIEAELIDLRNYSLPFFDEPISPAMSGGKYTLDLASKWAEKIGEADGYILVSPEYNHGYSAVLKNALDYVYKEWNKKPVAFVSYGGVSAGTRSVQQLKQVVLELQMIPIRNAVHISNYWSLLDEKGNLKTDSLEDGARMMIEQLIWWAEKLKVIRETEK